jgi:hypothetical protein
MLQQFVKTAPKNAFNAIAAEISTTEIPLKGTYVVIIYI